MGKNSKKLVLDKNTVKSIKIKTEIKTGDKSVSGVFSTGGNVNPAQSLSANYSRVISVAF